MEAAGRAEASPGIFFVDIVTTLVHSVMNKDSYVKLGRWNSKSRHWWNGVANVGEGKSAGMKAFVDDMVTVLKQESPHAVGEARDRFQYQQSGTTAGAIDKLRACQAYLTLYCSDAGRCLSKPAATGGKTDPHTHIDLEFFLDAAHGDEFNHSTDRTREEAKKKRLKIPKESAMEEPSIHMDPTNVHLMYMQQEVFLQTYWALIADKHPIGLPQRSLFAFAGDTDPAPKEINGFFQDVARPLTR